MTRQREIVLRLVRNAMTHMTADEIYAAACKEMPSMVKATVYNNLNALTAAGEISRIQVANGPDHFDKTVYRHFHMVCDRCGKMSDIMGLPDPTRFIEEKYHIRVNAMDLNAHYICEECMKGD